MSFVAHMVRLSVAAAMLVGCAEARMGVRMPLGALLDRPPGLAGALEVGAQAPAVNLQTSAGQPWSLAGQLATGPVVLIFYRGNW